MIISGLDLQLLQNKFYPEAKTIYLPNPSWPNHAPVFRQSGLEVKSYRHCNWKNMTFDAAGCYDDLNVCHIVTILGHCIVHCACMCVMLVTVK